MKKDNITLAVALAFSVAAVSRPAHAESSVVLFGAVDGGLLTQTSSAASFSPNAPNTKGFVRYQDGGVDSSVFGMSGREDLGNGYQATFRLVGSFDSGSGKSGPSDTAGVSALFGRTADVGMTGPFGSVTAGRQVTPMLFALAATDVRGAQNFGSVMTALIGINTAAGWQGASTNGPLGSVYDSNAIVYSTPTFAGVSATLEYAPGGVAGQPQGGTRESAVLQYNNYGLQLAAVYYNGHDTNPPLGSPPAPNGDDNNRFVSLSALYARGPVSVSLLFANGRNPSNSGAASFDIISGGMGYQITPALSLTSGIYFLRDNNVSSNRSTAFALGGTYSLSKRTLVYLNGGYVDNRGTMNQTLAYGQPVAPGVGTSAFNLGLRHTF